MHQSNRAAYPVEPAEEKPFSDGSVARGGRPVGFRIGEVVASRQFYWGASESSEGCSEVSVLSPRTQRQWPGSAGGGRVVSGNWQCDAWRHGCMSVLVRCCGGRVLVRGRRSAGLG
eukprot:2658174-Alexandrium_andersonii.AAC.1